MESILQKGRLVMGGNTLCLGLEPRIQRILAATFGFIDVRPGGMMGVGFALNSSLNTSTWAFLPASVYGKMMQYQARTLQKE